MKINPLLKPIKEAPNLRGLIDELKCFWSDEQVKRNEFQNWITPDIKAEFIGGEIIVHSPVVKKHNVITKQLVKVFDDYIIENKLGFLGVEKIMCRLERNDYEPDICFFKSSKSNNFTDEQTIFPVPDFVVEIVSKSTEERDRGIKKLDYALNGVQEYWIIVPDTECIEQYILNGKEYIEPIIHSKGEIKCLSLGDLTIPLELIF